MIAEIHNKLASGGSNLHDRLEDQLTGNIFGTMRYLPFSLGLGPVLRKTHFETESQAVAFQSALSAMDDDETVEYRFWPKHPNGEIDLLIETATTVIGIEVKYRSGLSSDDEVEISDEAQWTESRNQLARYQSVVRDFAKGKKMVLLFAAPTELGWAVYRDVIRRRLIQEEIGFGLLTWENILTGLEDRAGLSLDRYQDRMLGDMVDLLRKKGFEHFRGFALADLPFVDKTQQNRIEIRLIRLRTDHSETTKPSSLKASGPPFLYGDTRWLM
ncbi:MAG TPA: hypothetical protein VEZ72_17165 [Paenibacillus sp.]|nr:hypothetical protein [Paenibacillus sp.]